MRAALRRFGEPEHPEPAEPFALGDLRIDYAQRRVTVSRLVAPLTPTEYDLLAELAAAGRVVPHDRLLRRVWSPGKPGNLRVRRTHLMWLRRKLGEDAANPHLHLRRAQDRVPDGGGETASGEPPLNSLTADGMVSRLRLQGERERQRDGS